MNQKEYNHIQQCFSSPLLFLFSFFLCWPRAELKIRGTGWRDPERFSLFLLFPLPPPPLLQPDMESKLLMKEMNNRSMCAPLALAGVVSLSSFFFFLFFSSFRGLRRDLQRAVEEGRGRSRNESAPFFFFPFFEELAAARRRRRNKRRTLH